jgi:hypothetical protein
MERNSVTGDRGITVILRIEHQVKLQKATHVGEVSVLALILRSSWGNAVILVKSLHLCNEYNQIGKPLKTLLYLHYRILDKFVIRHLFI